MSAQEVAPVAALPALPAVRERPALSDAGAVALAVAVAAGAWWSSPQPVVFVVGTLALALGLRRPLVVMVAAFVVASALGARAEAGMHPPEAGSYRGTVTMLSDPGDVPGGVRAEVRAGSRHLSMTASGAAATSVGHHLAGDHLTVIGRVRPLSGRNDYLHARHVSGRLTAEEITHATHGSLPWRLANVVHRAVDRAADYLPSGSRALYRGFLLGDARGEPVATAADMRAAGLGHLLVVSGENVAFLLTLCGPLLRRIGLRYRWIPVFALIAAFTVLTRFEPSVLRAVVMAGLGAAAMSKGTPASTLRLLALSVAGLVLVDPFLVHQVGFGLSVGATAGICILGRPLAAVLPGPRSLAGAAATTIAAQIGVAPIAVVAFGGLPVAALPANVAAAPAAAAVLVWGLPAGLAAQMVGGAPAALLQLPTRHLVGWIAGVARVSAGVPLGQLGAPELAVLGCAVAAVVIGQRVGRRWVVRSAAFVAFVALLVPAWRVAHPSLRTGVAGADVWRHGATVVVLRSGARSGDLFDGLHRIGVRRIDLLVSSSGGPGPAGTIADLRTRWRIGTVLAPPDNEIRDATPAPDGSRWRVGRLAVEVHDDHPKLVVAIAADSGK